MDAWYIMCFEIIILENLSACFLCLLLGFASNETTVCTSKFEWRRSLFCCGLFYLSKHHHGPRHFRVRRPHRLPGLRYHIIHIFKYVRPLRIVAVREVLESKRLQGHRVPPLHLHQRKRMQYTRWCLMRGVYIKYSIWRLEANVLIPISILSA